MENISPHYIASSIPELQIQTTGIDMDTFRKRLSAAVNQLIQHNFSQLISILYRLDISEMALKEALTDTAYPASDIIASMIIERQIQKAESRKLFKSDWDIADEEKW